MFAFVDMCVFSLTAGISEITQTHAHTPPGDTGLLKAAVCVLLLQDLQAHPQWLRMLF